MFNKFLCGPHRKELNAHPEKAVRLCGMAFETGQNLTSCGIRKDALAHLGCAFEASEIVMSNNPILHFDAIGMFNETSSALIHCLQELGYEEQSQAVLKLAINRLYQHADSYPELRNVIQTYVVSLHDFSNTAFHQKSIKPTPNIQAKGNSQQHSKQAALVPHSAQVSHTIH